MAILNAYGMNTEGKEIGKRAGLEFKSAPPMVYMVRGTVKLSHAGSTALHGMGPC